MRLAIQEECRLLHTWLPREASPVRPAAAAIKARQLKLVQLMRLLSQQQIVTCEAVC